jgi:hypothetical protein
VTTGQSADMERGTRQWPNLAGIRVGVVVWERLGVGAANSNSNWREGKGREKKEHTGCGILAWVSWDVVVAFSPAICYGRSAQGPSSLLPRLQSVSGEELYSVSLGNPGNKGLVII